MKYAIDKGIKIPWVRHRNRNIPLHLREPKPLHPLHPAWDPFYSIAWGTPTWEETQSTVEDILRAEREAIREGRVTRGTTDLREFELRNELEYLRKLDQAQERYWGWDRKYWKYQGTLNEEVVARRTKHNAYVEWLADRRDGGRERELEAFMLYGKKNAP